MNSSRLAADINTHASLCTKRREKTRERQRKTVSEEESADVFVVRDRKTNGNSGSFSICILSVSCLTCFKWGLRAKAQLQHKRRRASLLGSQRRTGRWMVRMFREIWQYTVKWCGNSPSKPCLLYNYVKYLRCTRTMQTVAAGWQKWYNFLFWKVDLCQQGEISR